MNTESLSLATAEGDLAAGTSQDFIAPGETPISMETKSPEAEQVVKTEAATPETLPAKTGKKGSKKAKIKTTEPVVPVEIVCANEGMLQFDGSKITMPPRGYAVPVPAILYLEKRNVKVKPDAKRPGQEINSGAHQWDHRRDVSYMAVMPNLALYSTTGNVYPASAAHPTVKTSKAWEPFVEMANIAFAAIKTSFAGKPFNTVQLMDEVKKRTKLPLNSKGSDDNAWKALRDMLRDCRLAGVLVSNKMDFDRTSVFFKLVDKIEDIKTLDRSSEAPVKPAVPIAATPAAAAA